MTSAQSRLETLLKKGPPHTQTVESYLDEIHAAAEDVLRDSNEAGPPGTLDKNELVNHLLTGTNCPLVDPKFRVTSARVVADETAHAADIARAAAVNRAATALVAQRVGAVAIATATGNYPAAVGQLFAVARELGKALGAR